VPEAERVLLAGVGDLARLQHRGGDLGQLLVFRALVQRLGELVGVVEMVLDRRLAAAGDEDELLDPGGLRLLDRVLDDRLVDDRQHLLRQRLGRRKEARAQPADREDRLAHPLAHARSIGSLVGLVKGGGPAPRRLLP
jgi:hypothetical protein